MEYTKNSARLNLLLIILATNYALIHAMQQETDIPFKKLVEQPSAQRSVMIPSPVEPLLDEGNANNRGAELEEVVIELPTINIPQPKLMSGPNVMCGLAITSGATAGFVIGSLIISFSPQSVVNDVIGGLMITGGLATCYGLVRYCQNAKRSHQEDVADLAVYIPHAQQALLNHRTLPYHMNIADTLLNRIYTYSKMNYKEGVSTILCTLDAKPQWNPGEEANKFTEFTNAAQHIIANLPHPEEEQPLTAEELLPISRALLRETLTHETATLATRNLIARYPISFVNRFYHNDCPLDKKASFAEAMAIAAADVHGNNVLSLTPPNMLSESDKRKFLVQARNAYFNKITELAIPSN